MKGSQVAVAEEHNRERASPRGHAGVLGACDVQLRAWRTVTFPDCSFRAVGTSLSDPRQTSSTPLQPPQGTVGNAGGCKLDAEAGAAEAAVSW